MFIINFGDGWRKLFHFLSEMVVRDWLRCTHPYATNLLILNLGHDIKAYLVLNLIRYINFVNVHLRLKGERGGLLCKCIISSKT